MFQVLRLGTKDGIITGITEVIASDGDLITASSVAVNYKDRVVVGSVLNGALMCELNTF